MKELIINKTKCTLFPNKILLCNKEGIQINVLIPKQFTEIAIEFYDLLLENRKLSALIATRKDYDIAIIINEKNGNIVNWNYKK